MAVDVGRDLPRNPPLRVPVDERLTVKVHIITPGKLHHPAAIAWAQDLSARITRVLPLMRTGVREAKRHKGGVDLAARKQEGDAILAALPTGAHLVALDAAGQRMDSDAFYDWFKGLAETGCKELVFAIGGPDGHEPTLLLQARSKLSLSPMTLPHELAEVVLVEQVYRAVARWKGLPYHR